MPRGERLPPPLFPGFDSLGALRHITVQPDTTTPGWCSTAGRLSTEFALSGSEQNPDLTGKDLRQLIGRARGGPTGPVQAFLDHGADFVVRPTVAELAKGMNELTGTDLIEAKTRSGASSWPAISRLPPAWARTHRSSRPRPPADTWAIG